MRMVKMELFNFFTVMIVIKEETFLQSYIAKQTPLTIIKQCLMKSARENLRKISGSVHYSTRSAFHHKMKKDPTTYISVLKHDKCSIESLTSRSRLPVQQKKKNGSHSKLTTSLIVNSLQVS